MGGRYGALSQTLPAEWPQRRVEWRETESALWLIAAPSLGRVIWHRVLTLELVRLLPELLIDQGHFAVVCVALEGHFNSEIELGMP